MANYSQRATERSARPEIRAWELPEVPEAGRAVEITDECARYIAVLPPQMDLADAISAFSSTYDFNGESCNIQCTARLYVDGAETESRDFVLES